MKLSRRPRYHYPPDPRPAVAWYVWLMAAWLLAMATIVAADATLGIQRHINSANATATAVQAYFEPTRVSFPTRALPVTPTPPGGYP